jgi:hypothetical protein
MEPVPTDLEPAEPAPIEPVEPVPREPLPMELEPAPVVPDVPMPEAPAPALVSAFMDGVVAELLVELDVVPPRVREPRLPVRLELVVPAEVESLEVVAPAPTVPVEVEPLMPVVPVAPAEPLTPAPLTPPVAPVDSPVDWANAGPAARAMIPPAERRRCLIMLCSLVSVNNQRPCEKVPEDIWAKAKRNRTGDLCR